MLRNFVALTVWAYLTWVLLTWTLTLEQQLVGLGIAVVIAFASMRLGPVVAPWRLLDPRRLVSVFRLIGASAAQIVRANVELARRIWTPSLPIRSGMVIVRSGLRSDGGVAGTGLITSLIVDNQIVDLDRERDLMQYHAISVPKGGVDEAAESINAPTERLIRPLL